MRIQRSVVVVIATIVVVVLLVGWSRTDAFSVDPAIYGLGLHQRPKYLSTPEPSPTQAMEVGFGPGSEVSYHREGFGTERTGQPFDPVPYIHDYGERPGYVQHFGPSLSVERNYYDCLRGVSPRDDWGKQVCWTKAMTQGSPGGVCELLCGQETDSRYDQFGRDLCLDQCYSHEGKPLVRD